MNLTRVLIIATAMSTLIALGTFGRGESLAPVVWGIVTLGLGVATASTMRSNLAARGSRLTDRADDDGWMDAVDRRAGHRDGPVR